MSAPTNPPPTRIPKFLQKDRETGQFFTRLLKDVYLIWAKSGGGGLVPISEGGTGASTAAGARSNLSLYSKAEIDAFTEESRRYALMVG